MTVAEMTQTIFAAAMLPVASLFILMFGRPGERWYRTNFGISLMLIAVAMIEASVSTALFRFFGPTYPGRNFVIISSSLLALVAMTLRTAVLWRAQWHDYEQGRATFWLFRFIDRLRRK